MQINLNNNKTLFQKYKQDIEVGLRMYSPTLIQRLYSFNLMFFLNPVTGESRRNFKNLIK